jgi:hypothetical protein
MVGKNSWRFKTKSIKSRKKLTGKKIDNAHTS